jgi:hypothetical protein
MGSTKKPNAGSAASEARRQTLRATVDGVIKAHFASTLGTQDDIVNIVLGLMLLESGWNPSKHGGTVSKGVGTSGYDYWASTPVQNILQKGSPQQKTNLEAGLVGVGLGQVMGWNFVRGASKVGGKCEIERLRPDLAGLLCVDAGEDVLAKIQGEANIALAVTACLVLLEGKWKAVKQTKEGWSTGKYVYPLRISAAVSAYLGNGNADKNGTTPPMYAASIVGGAMYKSANGASAPAIRDSQVQYASSTAAKPGTAVASASKSTSQPGCIQKTLT